MTRRSLVLGLLAAGMTGCGAPEGKVSRLTGVVQATPAIVAAPVAGRIAGVVVEEGEDVERGQPLATLDATRIQDEIQFLEEQVTVLEGRSRVARALGELEVTGAAAAREGAEAQLEMASGQRDRAQKIVDEHDRNPPHIRRRVEAGRIVEERDDLGRLQSEWADARLSFFELQVAAAEEAVRAAESARQVAEVRADDAPEAWAGELLERRRRLAEARRRFEEHTIRAPFSGVVSVKVRNAGELVERGEPIVVLHEAGRLWVGVSVEESLAASITAGDRIAVELPGGRIVESEVQSVSPAGEFATQRDVDRQRRDIRAFRLKLRLPEDSGAKPGGTAYVRIRD